MSYETLKIDLARSERTATRIMRNISAQKALIVSFRKIGIDTLRLYNHLGMLEQAHDICLEEVRRLKAAIAALPLH